MIEGFFANYTKQGPRESLVMLLSSNKYISRSVADTVALKLERFTKGLGNYQGYEKVGEVTYGQSIYLLTYIVKYTQQPLRFKFKFYQPGNGIRVQNFGYEVDFLDEIEEVTKVDGIHRSKDIE
jgi:hypothetical protein